MRDSANGLSSFVPWSFVFMKRNKRYQLQSIPAFLYPYFSVYSALFRSDPFFCSKEAFDFDYRAFLLLISLLLVAILDLRCKTNKKHLIFPFFFELMGSYCSSRLDEADHVVDDNVKSNSREFLDNLFYLYFLSIVPPHAHFLLLVIVRINFPRDLSVIKFCGTWIDREREIRFWFGFARWILHLEFLLAWLSSLLALPLLFLPVRPTKNSRILCFVWTVFLLFLSFVFVA